MPALSDEVQTQGGTDGANQHGGWFFFLVGDDIKHPMLAISEINIGMSGGAVHHPRAICLAGFGMAGQIAFALIGFGFNDDARHRVAVQINLQRFTQQGGCNLYC